MRAQSELEMRILALIEPTAKAEGLDIVRVRVMGRGTPVLQIMAERPDGGMDIDDCARFSRALHPVLETEDPISGEYNLEISSPGIDRPLTRQGDFGRWTGHEVKIETALPLDGRRRFHGSISSEGPEGVKLTLKDGGEVLLPVSEMVKAHLVLTDRLIEEARARGGAPAADLTDDDNGADFDAVEVEDDSEHDAGGEDDFADDDEDEEDERNH